MRFLVSIKIFCFLITLPTLLCGKIIETDSIMSILEYVQKETLVIADLDNTLIESETQLGSSQWGDYLGTLYTEPGKSFEEIDLLIAKMACKVQPVIKIRCVDPQTLEMINQLHEQRVDFMGLTARRPCEIHYTHKQLTSLKINLSNIINEGFLGCISDSAKGIIYHQGVVFCTPMHKKSYALALFLEKSKLYPKRIVFIDDKLSHVKDICQLAEYYLSVQKLQISSLIIFRKLFQMKKLS
jgi:FMN phosphatase YigB (HAD superfamily)